MNAPRRGFLRVDNRRMLGKLLVMVLVMFGFGYALVPMYRTICTALGINVLTVSSDRAASWSGSEGVANTQVDPTRTVTVIFDANAHGPWAFKPETRSVKVHPGQVTTVMYDFTNTLTRKVNVQAIPSYAPMQAAAHFTKLECFCFSQHALAPGESKRWPVVFVFDPKLPRDVSTITLSYTFFEVGVSTPMPPAGPDT